MGEPPLSANSLVDLLQLMVAHGCDLTDKRIVPETLEDVDEKTATIAMVRIEGGQTLVVGNVTQTFKTRQELEQQFDAAREWWKTQKAAA